MSGRGKLPPAPWQRHQPRIGPEIGQPDQISADNAIGSAEMAQAQLARPRARHPCAVEPGHGYPILDAWNRGIEAIAWCPRCRCWHIHGAQRRDEPIHLQAHCHQVGGYSSYVLRLMGRATREMVADAYRRRRNQIGPDACIERERLRSLGLYPTKRRRKRRSRW
jgi:hypothetical protein